jgi:hypothetical protein
MIMRELENVELGVMHVLAITSLASKTKVVDDRQLYEGLQCWLGLKKILTEC